MSFSISDTVVKTWADADSRLRGRDRRLFRASVVKAAGYGAAFFLFKKLRWHAPAIRKGLQELESGVTIEDNFQARGRDCAEDKLPNLEADLRAMAEQRSQTDPTFCTTQLYRKLTGEEARRRLIEEHGYPAKETPSARSLRRKLSAYGFHPTRVAKSKPLKKIPETNAIFDVVHRINDTAEADPGTIRISLDTKTSVPIGNLSRGGKSRQKQQAQDHDLGPETKLTPFGVHCPATAQTWLAFTTGSVTADFMVDRLEEIWPTLKKTILVHIPS